MASELTAQEREEQLAAKQAEIEALTAQVEKGAKA